MNISVSIILFIGLLLGSMANAQPVLSVKEIKAVKSEYENVKVTPVHSDESVSSFIIFVKKEVAPHFHKAHTEQVLVLEGKGIMQLGDERRKVRKGDFIIIPKGTVHSVKVIGRKPMKVLSVQAPEFDGKDRIFVETINR